MTTVAQRPIIDRRRPREPSGLERFLAGLSTAASTAGTITEIATLPRRFRMQEEAAERDERRVQVQEGQLGLQEDIFHNQMRQQSDESFFSMLAGMQGFNRATMMDQAGEAPDISALVGSFRIGDISDPGLREQARERLAAQAGIEPEQVSDSFVINQTSVGEALNEVVATQTLNKLFEMSQTGELDPLTEHAVGQAFGAPAGTMPGELMIQQSMANTVIHELLHVEEGPHGEKRVMGSLYNAPNTGLRTAAEAMGLEIHREFDIGGERVILPQRVLDDHYKMVLEEAFDIRADHRQTRLRVIEDLSKDLNIPMSVATNMVDGKFEEVPQEWQGVAASVLRSRWAAEVSVLALDPAHRIIEEATSQGREMGLEGDQLVDWVENRYRQGAAQLGLPTEEIETKTGFWRRLFQRSPSVIINRSDDVRRGLFDLVGADPFDQFVSPQTLDIGGHNFTRTPQGGVVAPPGMSSGDFMRGFANGIPELVDQLIEMDRDEAERYIQELQMSIIQFEDINTPILSPQQAEMLREQLKLRRTVEGAQQAPGILSGPGGR